MRMIPSKFQTKSMIMYEFCIDFAFPNVSLMRFVIPISHQIHSQFCKLLLKSFIYPYTSEASVRVASGSHNFTTIITFHSLFCFSKIVRSSTLVDFMCSHILGFLHAQALVCCLFIEKERNPLFKNLIHSEIRSTWGSCN